MADIVLITGPAGAGKTTIADALARQSEQSARINVDYVRESIVGGYVLPYPSSAAAYEQIILAVKNTCAMARNFVDSGYRVFIDDVVVSKRLLDYYYEQLKGYSLTVILLLPSLEVLKKRDLSRREEIRMGQRALELHNLFMERRSESRWNVIDTSDHDVEQTVAAVTSALTQ